MLDIHAAETLLRGCPTPLALSFERKPFTHRSSEIDTRERFTK